MEPRYRVKKVIGGEVTRTHDCYTWEEVESVKTSINLVKGRPVVETINRHQ